MKWRKNFYLFIYFFIFGESRTKRVECHLKKTKENGKQEAEREY